MLLLHSIDFAKLCFHFHLSQSIFWFPLWFLHWLLCFLVACCLIPTSLFHCCGGKHAWYNFYPLNICLGLFCELVCGPSWRMFHGHLKIMCHLLFWYEISCKNLWSPVVLLCNLKLQVHYWVPIWIICSLISADC